MEFVSNGLTAWSPSHEPQDKHLTPALSPFDPSAPVKRGEGETFPASDMARAKNLNQRREEADACASLPRLDRSRQNKAVSCHRTPKTLSRPALAVTITSGNCPARKLPWVNPRVQFKVHRRRGSGGDGEVGGADPGQLLRIAP